MKVAKWDVLYEGPYEVVGSDQKHAYVLKDTDGVMLGRHFTVDQLKIVAGQKGDERVSYVIKELLDHRKGPNGMEYLI